MCGWLRFRRLAAGRERGRAWRIDRHRGGNCSGVTRIDKSLSITGAGALSTTLDGVGKGRVLEIQSKTAVTVSYLTISNGLAVVEDSHAQGGGICNLGSLRLDNVVVVNNAAMATPGRDGLYNGHA